MENKQLTVLNPNHFGKPYYCLAYAYSFLGAKPKYECAYDSWKYNSDKNYGYDYPKDVAVPLYFSWYGTIDGEYKNWGHCAVSYNNKIYSGPRVIHKDEGREIFNTIAEVEKAYGAKYLGYSSIINDIKVYELEKNNDIKYIVKKGDTLSSVANLYNINYMDLYELNKELIDNENIKRGIDKNKMWIYPGQELSIKK